MEKCDPIEKCTKCYAVGGGQIETECLPVPHFGAIHLGVKVATISINPAQREFFIGGAPKDDLERLPILNDYGKSRRSDLTSKDISDAHRRRNHYFYDAVGNPRPFYCSWFKPLQEILKDLEFNWSYLNGTAIHFDLVACTTGKSWRNVMGKETLQQNCAPYFRQTLSKLPAGTILLSNGVEPNDIPSVIQVRSETLETLPRLKVWHGSLSHDNRSFLFLGWSQTANVLTNDQKKGLSTWLKQYCGKATVRN